eukprot:scaffold380526_cov43-Prasinocladus_malaysianus.AAC.1
MTPFPLKFTWPEERERRRSGSLPQFLSEPFNVLGKLAVDGQQQGAASILLLRRRGEAVPRQERLQQPQSAFGVHMQPDQHVCQPHEQRQDVWGDVFVAGMRTDGSDP